VFFKKYVFLQLENKRKRLLLFLKQENHQFLNTSGIISLMLMVCVGYNLFDVWVFGDASVLDKLQFHAFLFN